MTNMQRTDEFWAIHTRIKQCWNDWLYMLGWLRCFYLRIAENTGKDKGASMSRNPAICLIEDDTQIDGSLPDYLPLNWRRLCKDYKRFPAFFMQNVIEQFIQWDGEDAQMQLLSDIELSVALARCSEFCFPLWDPDCQRWVPRSYQAHFEKPLLSRLIGVVSPCLDELVCLFSLGSFRMNGVKCVPLGIEKSGKGIFVRMPVSIRLDLNEYICRFTARRPIRSAADLSRPLC